MPPFDEQAVLAKVGRRLIPFMFVLYVVAYLDRINVGFAALQMREDLGFDAAVYGFGASIFFLGYFVFEIPSNLILARVGARTWIARIMLSWGVVSMAMAAVVGPWSFYLLRLLLGIAEAGFFPGMILYLTYWFPAAVRARAIARFLTATAIAGVVGGPLSGLLLALDGVGGLHGWQWLFLLEGMPAVALGAVVLLRLPNGPADADFLTPEERRGLAARLAAEGPPAHGHTTVRAALGSGRVWLLGLLYFLLVNGFYGVSFWLPQILQRLSGASDLAVGVATAVPYLVAAVGMVVVGAHSDRTGERRWHVAVPALVGALGLVLASRTSVPALGLAALSVAALGIWSALGPFWALPTSLLGGTAAAAGIALVNSLGNLGGFVAPNVLGLVERATGSVAGGLDALAIGLAAAGALALGVGRRV